jgi:hypothetical protein
MFRTTVSETTGPAELKDAGDVDFSSAAAWVDVSVSRFIESMPSLDSIRRRLAEYRRVAAQRPSLRVDSKMPVLWLGVSPSGFALACKDWNAIQFVDVILWQSHATLSVLDRSRSVWF